MPSSFSYFTMGVESMQDVAENLTKIRCEGICLSQGYHQCNFYHYDEASLTCSWGKV